MSVGSVAEEEIDAALPRLRRLVEEVVARAA
jgi:ribosomal protein S21